MHSVLQTILSRLSVKAKGSFEPLTIRVDNPGAKIKALDSGALAKGFKPPEDFVGILQ